MVIFFLSFLAGLVLASQAFIGSAFFISCLREKEKRAAIFAGFQAAGMYLLLILYVFFLKQGLLETTPGLTFLATGILAACLIAYLLLRGTGRNPKALQGSKGLMIGKVKRYDEREIVFARNRSLPPGSEVYKKFYLEHPEYEKYDAKRRQRGGPLGRPGDIDNPGGLSNVAAALAPVTISLALSKPRLFRPETHPEMKGKEGSLSPEEATNRLDLIQASPGRP